MTLHAGFSPDPKTTVGRTTVEVEASTLSDRCQGWIGSKPDVLIDAKTAFFKLHIMVRSSGDALLVIRKPDGKVLCNDNRDGGKNPMVHSSFPIGVSQVFVGTPIKGPAIDYRLGVSEVKWKPSDMPLP